VKLKIGASKFLQNVYNGGSTWAFFHAGYLNEFVASNICIYLFFKINEYFFMKKKKFLQKLYKNAFKFPKKNAFKIFIYNRNKYMIISGARNIYF